MSKLTIPTNSVPECVTMLSQQVNQYVYQFSGADANVRPTLDNLLTCNYKVYDFEKDLFDFLVKLDLAKKNETQSRNMLDHEYPFEIILVPEKSSSKLPLHLVSTKGFLIIKFCLYIRYLRKLIGYQESQKVLLGICLHRLPFQRVFIDVDFKVQIDSNVHSEFCRYAMKRLMYITGGDVTLTQNLYTSNTQNFHLLSNRQFDIATCQYLLLQFSVDLTNHFSHLTNTFNIDHVISPMLPFGRGHIPKLVSENNVIKSIDNIISMFVFESLIPFDTSRMYFPVYTSLSHLSDNHEKVTRKLARQTTNLEPDLMNADTLMEAPCTSRSATNYILNGENCTFHDQNLSSSSNNTNSVSSFTPYSITELKAYKANIKETVNVFTRFSEHSEESDLEKLYTLTLISRNIPAKKNLFDCMNRTDYFSFTDSTVVFSMKLIVDIQSCEFISSFLKYAQKGEFQKAALADLWGVYGTSTDRPLNEAYEIYRVTNISFINDENINSFTKKCPRSYVNVVSRITDINQSEVMDIQDNLYDELASESHEIEQMFQTNVSEEIDNDANRTLEEYYNTEVSNNSSPSAWPCITRLSKSLITPNASESMKLIHRFYREENNKNVYPYERSSDFEIFQHYLKSIMQLAPILSPESYIKNNDLQSIYSLYTFFCKVNYIKCILDSQELTQLTNYKSNDLLKLGIPSCDETTAKLTEFRKHMEISPHPNIYKFPLNNSFYDSSKWNNLNFKDKIFYHIIYMMIVEGNITNVFVMLYNILNKYTNISFRINAVLAIITRIIYDDNEGFVNREMIHFLYKKFFNCGVNMKVPMQSSCLDFSSSTYKNLMNDLLSFYPSCPIHYFLSGFQYMNEELEYFKRIARYISIFSQPAATTNETPSTNRRQAKKKEYNESTSSIFNHLCHYNINKDFHLSITNDIAKFIIMLLKKFEEFYIYTEYKFIETKDPKIISLTNRNYGIEPHRFAHYYRRPCGIFNIYLQMHERHHPGLVTRLGVSANRSLQENPQLFNTHNVKLQNIIYNRYLKMLHFIDVINLQKQLVLFLAPIYDPTMSTNYDKTLNYVVDSVQINIIDMQTNSVNLPDDMMTDLFHNADKYPHLIYYFKWLYMIVCHFSELYMGDINQPMSLLHKSLIPTQTIQQNIGMLQEDLISIDVENTDIDPREALKNVIRRYSSKTDSAIEEKLKTIQDHNLQFMIGLQAVINMNSRSSAVSENMEIDVDNSPNHPEETIPNSNRKKNLEIFHISTKNVMKSKISGHLDKSDRLMEYFDMTMPPNSHILNMEPNEFIEILNANFGKPLFTYILSILSWCVRILHNHDLQATEFFMQLTPVQQSVYDELVAFFQQHCGQFLVSESLIDLRKMFSIYCASTQLHLPTLENNIQSNLPVDFAINPDESDVDPSTITSIENGCAAHMIQSQFNAHIAVDLTKFWLRTQVPINVNREAAVIKGCTNAGKSAYARQKVNEIQPPLLSSSICHSADLQKNERGSRVADQGNVCLILFIDEVTKLGNEFKTVANDAPVTFLKLHTNASMKHQMYGTFLITCNSPPECIDHATTNRIFLFDRWFQFCVVDNNAKFSRWIAINNMNIETINDIVGVQQFLHRLPKGDNEDITGNYFIHWHLFPLFSYNMHTPITFLYSEFMKKQMDTLKDSCDPVHYIRTHFLDFSTEQRMTLEEFRLLIQRILNENAKFLPSKQSTQVIISELHSVLKNYIRDRDNTINVAEKKH